MELILKEMSDVSVPDSFLSQIDMPALIQGFKKDFNKLDDIKDARNRHEERNFLSRWWNKDELEDAQLDAVELQASFSKRLGQLMVISIEQSKLLTQQQDHLTSQQNEIKKQASDLSSANIKLNEQQEKQLEQQSKLQDLVEDYFELKGLTSKDAEKLILIANEVKEMKTSIFNQLEIEISAINQLKNELFEQFENEVELINSKFSILESSTSTEFEKVNNNFSDALQAQSQELVDLVESEKVHILNKVDSLSKTLETLENKTKKLASIVNANIKDHSEQLGIQNESLRLLSKSHEDFSYESEKKFEELQIKLFNCQNEVEKLTVTQNKRMKLFIVGLSISTLIGSIGLGVVLFPLLS